MLSTTLLGTLLTILIRRSRWCQPTYQVAAAHTDLDTGCIVFLWRNKKPAEAGLYKHDGSGEIHRRSSWAVRLNRRDTTITSLSGGIHFALANDLPITCVQGEVVLGANGGQLLVVGIVRRVDLHRLDTILTVRLDGIAFADQDLHYTTSLRWAPYYT